MEFGSNASRRRASTVPLIWISILALFLIPISSSAQTYDAGISDIVRPSSLVQSAFTPKIVLKNYGTGTINSISIEYNLNGSSSSTYNWTGSLAAGAHAVITLPTQTPSASTSSFSASTSGLINGSQSDANAANNGYVQHLAYQTSFASSLPYSQDFDSWNTSSTNKNCGTNASLSGNWINIDNTSGDDIDWRVGTGSTGTGNTGPSAGAGGSDKYLYTEGGQGSSKCKYMEGIALTPALDLNDLERPQLKFSYHMYGTHIGTFSIGVYSTSGDSAILFQVHGDQGNIWKTDSVSLEEFYGDTVVISFKHYTGGGIRSDMALDNISIENEACKTVKSISLGGVTDNSLSVSWVKGGVYANKWDVVYVNSGSAPSSGTPITVNNDTTYNFGSLSGNTTYDVYVREYCNNNSSVTPWQGPLTGTTLCTSANATYAEGFEGGIPSCWPQDQSDDFDWSINSGQGPNYPQTGPLSAHAGANYLFLNSSGKSAGAEAIIYTPPIDVSTLSNPGMSFAINMNGYDDAKLFVEAYDVNNDSWDIIFEETAENLIGWVEHSVDLSNYASNNVYLRFRGKLANNNNYQYCDLAIDKISFKELALPFTEYRPSILNPCLGEAVEFRLFDTYEGPNTFEWSFTPDSVAFINGTSSSSKEPVVQFLSESSFDVQLISCNSVGCDTLKKEDYIFSAQILSIPFSESFEGNVVDIWKRWTTSGFSTNNWDLEAVSGSTVGNTAMVFPAFSNNKTGDRFILRSPNFYLGNVQNATLEFDHSYVRRNISSSDSLIVYASSDCGATRDRLGSWGENGNGTFSTTNPPFTLTSSFIPANDDEWCIGTPQGASCHSIDLSAYVGLSKVMIIFEVYNNNGNNIYIDNVELTTTASFDTLTWVNNQWTPSEPSIATDNLVVEIKDPSNSFTAISNFSCKDLIIRDGAVLELLKGCQISVADKMTVETDGEVIINNGCQITVGDL